MPTKTVGAAVRLLREAQGLTLREAARRADISDTLLSLIEAGERALTPKANELAAVLGDEIHVLAQAEGDRQLEELSLPRALKRAFQALRNAARPVVTAWGSNTGDLHRALTAALLGLDWRQVFSREAVAAELVRQLEWPNLNLSPADWEQVEKARRDAIEKEQARRRVIMMEAFEQAATAFYLEGYPTAGGWTEDPEYRAAEPSLLAELERATLEHNRRKTAALNPETLAQRVGIVLDEEDRLVAEQVCAHVRKSWTD